MFSLLPWRQVGSIYDLTGAALAEQDIRFLMADLDNTLCRYSDREPDGRLREWLADLERHGVRLFLLSNSRKPRRAAHFAETLGVPYLGHAGKPGTKGYIKAMEEQGFSKHDSAMIGDQVFTDTLGANLAGIRAILVRPISLKGNPGRYLRYWVELPIRIAAGRRTWGQKGDRP